MAERKVLSKYYPPDFDPAKLERRVRKPKGEGASTKVIPVRLMAPFPMKCTACGEFIYKGRKFNARKETTEEKYINIPIYRFYIRCTRCSGEITFKTDPKNMDYVSERGAKRNFEPWRANGMGIQESEEEMLDRLEREEEEKNAMVELETKTLDAKREMAVADALDTIRTRNARFERAGGDLEVSVAREAIDEERERQEKEDEDAARRAFMKAQEDMEEIVEDTDDFGFESGSSTPSVTSNFTKEEAQSMPPPPIPPTTTAPVPTFQRVVKKKKDLSSALRIKKKPSLVAAYDSDEDD